MDPFSQPSGEILGPELVPQNSGRSKKRWIIAATVIGILIIGGVIVGPSLITKIRQKFRGPVSGLCVPISTHAPLYGLQTNLSTSTFSYLAKRQEGIVVSGDGYEFNVGPVLIATEKSLNEFIGFLGGHRLASLNNSFALYGFESDASSSVFFVANLDAIKKPYTNLDKFVFFEVSVGPALPYATPQDERLRVMQKNAPFVREVLTSAVIGQCPERYDPTVSSDRAPRFQEIQGWLERLPLEVKVFFEDAVRVSAAEFTDKAISTGSFNKYEQCIRYLVGQGILHAAAVKTPFSPIPQTSMPGGMRWQDLQADAFYTDYIGLLRLRDFGDATIPPVITERIQKEKRAWSGIGNASFIPSRASCQKIVEYPQNTLVLSSLGVLEMPDPIPQPLSALNNRKRYIAMDDLLAAIEQNTLDNGGTFACTTGPIPAKATKIAASGYNIAPCLVPKYLSSLPYDPKVGRWINSEKYDTGFTIYQSEGGRLSMYAPAGEGGAQPTTYR